MPYVKELFGHVLSASGAEGGACRAAQCPHMAKLCDGGGNRDMVRWPAIELPLAPLFDPAVGEAGGGFIPCGVCSVHLGNDDRGTGADWAVCPRRLLTFESGLSSQTQRPLAKRVLQLAGFRDGDQVRIWSEVTLSDRQTNVDYRLDYVLRKDDDPPVIVEVMTASTSGGNKSKRTDMRSAFCDAVLFANGIQPERGASPGVNVRQVWARMASQMIVKSEIANKWGGCAIWIVQDSLLAYIRTNTGLRLNELRSPDWQLGEVNVVSANINDPYDLELYAGPIRSNDGEACWTDLLSAPDIPRIDRLTHRLADDAVITTLII